MRPRIPPAAVLLAVLAAAGPAGGASPGGPEPVSPRLHHLLDLEDARAPLRELEPFLRDPDPAVRARAALAAGRKGGPDAPALLRAAAKDPESAVRAAAWFAAGMTDDPGLAGDALVAAGRRESPPAERAAAAAAAVRLGGERVWREEAFAAPLRDGDPAVRRAAFRALAGAVRGWKEKPPAPPAWIGEALDSSGRDPEVRAWSALALRTLKVDPGDEDRIAALTAWMNEGPTPEVRWTHGLALPPEAAAHDVAIGFACEREKDPRVRAVLCRCLGRSKTPEGGEFLAKVLASDREFGVRAAAAEGLGARKEGAAPQVPALAKAAGEDPSRLVRVSAVLALQAAGGDGAKAAVLAASRSKDPFVRAAAAGPLLPGEDLARLAADPETRVRESAVDEAGGRGREGLATCLAALGDPDPVVAAIAAGGIGKMAPPGPAKGREGDAPKDAPAEAPDPPLEPGEAARAVAALRETLALRLAPARAPDDGADLRAAALEALGKWKAPDARKAALARLGDPDPMVRDAAAGVLEGLDGRRPDLPVPPRLLPFPERAALTVRDEGAPRVRFVTDRGAFVVQTIPSAAPVHVARFLERVRAKGYDGTLFHRVVPSFVVQGGDPRGDGSGNGGAPTRQEFSPVPFGRGTLGVPRSGHPDSGGCQLFFCHGETPHLDQRYTVLGRIVEGLDVVDGIDLGDRILRATVE